MFSKTVFFDLETGGLDYKRHPVIQIAAYHPESGDEFEAKVKFDPRRATPEALKINHYDEKVWDAEAKAAQEVAREFGEWLRHKAWIEKVSKKGKTYRVAQLAGHNAAAFDAPFIQEMFRNHSVFLPADYRVLDTMQLAMWLLPGRESYKQADLAASFGIDAGDAHDAMCDVRTCAALAEALRGIIYWPVSKSMFDIG